MKKIIRRRTQLGSGIVRETEGHTVFGARCCLVAAGEIFVRNVVILKRFSKMISLNSGYSVHKFGKIFEPSANFNHYLGQCKFYLMFFSRPKPHPLQTKLPKKSENRLCHTGHVCNITPYIFFFVSFFFE